MKPKRTIAIVNGGSRASGLNKVIRAIVRSAINGHRIVVAECTGKGIPSVAAGKR